jgi:hypothetical protein
MLKMTTRKINMIPDKKAIIKIQQKQGTLTILDKGKIKRNKI